MLSAKSKDLTKQKFGRWTVISLARLGDRNRPFWNCQCECGTLREVQNQSLLRGTSLSCGCYKKEAASIRFTTHGGSNTKLHETWRHMMDRCYNKKHAAYKWYGARGITVADEWHDFLKFAADNVDYETTNLSLDRENNNEGYSKDNCRWITMKEQQNNRRDTVIVEYMGNSRSIKQWAEHLGINYLTLHWRLRTAKWPIERAFTGVAV